MRTLEPFTREQLRDALVALENMPDDSGALRHARGTSKTAMVTDALIDAAFRDFPIVANRRGRRTARRSKRRRRWLRERADFLSEGCSPPPYPAYTIVMSPTWARWWMDFYNVEREL